MKPSTSQCPAAADSPTLFALRDAVEFIDSLSQDAFSEIASIAKLALFTLEMPEGYSHMDDIANALRAIWGKADDAENYINSKAEGVGCAYVDEARLRRWKALGEYRDKVKD